MYEKTKILTYQAVRDVNNPSFKLVHCFQNFLAVSSSRLAGTWGKGHSSNIKFFLEIGLKFTKKKTWKTCQILRWSVLRDVGCQRNILLRRRHQRRVGFLHNIDSEFGTATGLGCFGLLICFYHSETSPPVHSIFNIPYSILTVPLKT